MSDPGYQDHLARARFEIENLEKRVKEQVELSNQALKKKDVLTSLKDRYNETFLQYQQKLSSIGAEIQAVQEQTTFEIKTQVKTLLSEIEIAKEPLREEKQEFLYRKNLLTETEKSLQEQVTLLEMQIASIHMDTAMCKQKQQEIQNNIDSLTEYARENCSPQIIDALSRYRPASDSTNQARLALDDSTRQLEKQKKEKEERQKILERECKEIEQKLKALKHPQNR